MKKLFCLMAAVAVIALASQFASAATSNYSTGYYDGWKVAFLGQNAEYATGNWKDTLSNKYNSLQATDYNNAVTLDPKHPNWKPGNTDNTQWISSSAAGSGSNPGVSDGLYAFTVNFTQAIAGGKINWAADNNVVAVIINGEMFATEAHVFGQDATGYAPIFTSNAYQSLGTFLKEDGYFTTNFEDIKKIESLTFVVQNTNPFNSTSPMGLWVNLDGVVNVENPSTPEPATLAILGLGLCGLPLVRRFRRK
ncbi:MAG: PEP-CTERM sorting domain-containing protein [Thermoguttaceae bacterium]